MAFLSYAQNFEDVLLWRALKTVQNGFYVDVGAADPTDDSVTKAFYDRGWRGLNIEPVPEFAARLAAARPRDVNLGVAAGDRAGETQLHVIPGTGLSTLHQSAVREITEGWEVTVPLRTLTDILTEHAPNTIHFLKVDAEGSELAVLSGCDFTLFRPWIVVIEATVPATTTPAYADWEPILTRAKYRNVFFDGLNRYYVPEERFEILAPHFQTPVNVFDDFERYVDVRATRHDRSEVLTAVMARAQVAEASARDAYAHGFELARELAEVKHTAEARFAEMQAGIEARDEHVAFRDVQIATLHRHIDAMDAQAAALRQQLDAMERQAALGDHLVRAMRGSLSWRISRPLRVAGTTARKLGLLQRLQEPEEVTSDPLEGADPVAVIGDQPKVGERDGTVAHGAPGHSDGQADCKSDRVLAGTVHVPRPLTAVHQFHSGSAYGDAVTGSMLLIRGLLREMGYRSEIFVEHRDTRLADELQLLDDLPRHADHVLIVHHSIGHDALDRILSMPAPKILMYHNITPPEFLAGSPHVQRYARLGREQLKTMRAHFIAALAASEYNANELRVLGYAPVRACTLLFDLEALRRQASVWRAPSETRPFTVLFTGRVAGAKGQAEVVEAYARFRTAMDQPCQLVFVGRLDGAGPYLAEIDAAMRRYKLEAELVLTGLVSEEELHARFAEADLYLSLSHHEGFGIPLVEAIVHSLPVLAWPSGAIPYTLGDSDGLLDSRDPDRVAARMLAIARDPTHRAALIKAQRAAIDRFALPRQLPALHEALAMAGAVPPADDRTREALRDNLQFTVTGHAAGSYSLAAVNRGLARAIEVARPGTVRLRPVEGQRTDDLSGVPAAERPGIAPLVERGPAETGPEVVISQHYPVHVPEHPGDLPLAMLFWEESLLPAATIEVLAAGFRAVLAPTAVVAKALVDSGLPIPVRVTGYAPELDAMAAIGRERGMAPEPADGRVLTFLHVSSCFPRKGVDLLLTGFARAFRRGDAVRLVIKGFPNPHNTVAADLAAIQASDPDAPTIELIDRDLPEAELLTLYREADAMVLPTRGEGFNLPAAEAMAAGLPLIVTGHGGHLDFCDVETARLLRWRFAPSGSHLATPGSLWVEPDENDLVDALREVASALRTPAGRVVLADRVRRARLQVAQRLRPGRTVRRLEKAALDLLLAPPMRPIRVAWVTSWEVRCGVAEYARQLLQAMPAHPGIASHAILADDRWSVQSGSSSTSPHGVLSSWRIGDPASLAGLGSAIQAEDPQAVVVQHQPGLVSWEALARLLNAPALRDRAVAVTLHNTQHLLEQEEPSRGQTRDALARVDRVLVHSVADLERLRTIGLSGNVALMPHGVKAPAASWEELVGPPVIGCYGFFLPGKGISELIGALALLRRIWPEARLRLVNAEYGSPLSTEEIARCRAIAVAEGVEAAIEWHTDFLAGEESLALLAGCTVIVLPNQASKESSSASVRDALAAGPPVMVTPLAIFDEVGEAVFRTSGTDSADLSVGLDTLLRDPTLRETLRGSARGWLAARSWDLVARRMQSLILGLAATRHLYNGRLAMDKDDVVERTEG
ncbi:FkbM family methyltransferase [Roseomonas sp. WA12]